MTKRFSSGDSFVSGENPSDTETPLIDSELLKIIPEKLAKERGAIPLRRENGSVVVAVSGETTPDVLDFVKFRSGKGADFVSVSSETARLLIEKNYGAETGGKQAVAQNAFSPEAIKRIAEEASRAERGENPSDTVTAFTQSSPVVRLSNSIIEEAFSKRASDIHIEPYEDELRVRYRIDGVLYVFHTFPVQTAPILVSRFKVMFGLDIAEKRRAQQGRMKFSPPGGESFECRVSVVPVTFGEKVAIRILDRTTLQLSLSGLGFEDGQLSGFEKAVRAENGMILIAGPTGSGKTTTLYSAIEEIKSPETNIITVEDPIEYDLDGINQVQVRESTGLTFPECLRSFLRQDPDVILVGEIRDSETADIAVKASLTGHLMLSTVHTTDALSSIVRLLDMGIEPFLVASSLHAVVAQRLVRLICGSCKKPASINPSALAAAIPEETAAPESLFEGGGCAACSNTGYKGREAVFEVAVVDSELKEMIVAGASPGEMRGWAARKGMRTMRQNAIHKLSLGITTLEEVVKNTPPGDGGTRV